MSLGSLKLLGAISCVAMTGALQGCGSGETRGHEGSPPPPTAPSSPSLPPLPPVVEASPLSLQQSEGSLDPRYHFQPNGARVIEARPTAALPFSVTFGLGGTTLSHGGAALRAAFELSFFGCDGASNQLGAAPDPVPRLGDRPNRVERIHETLSGSLREWFVNGPLGLEQGFTVLAPPCTERDAAKLAVLELVVDGLRPAPLAPTDPERTTAVELVDDAGNVRLRYAGLAVTDRAGRTLPALMLPQGQRITLKFDLEGALFPVTVDPVWAALREPRASGVTGSAAFGSAIDASPDTALISAPDLKASTGAVYVYRRSDNRFIEQAKLEATDGATGDRFGAAVALDGDTALVGASTAKPNGLLSAGAAYLFSRSGGAWTQQQKLVASSPSEKAFFGKTVALLGDTAFVGAYGANGDTGAVYVFTKTGSSWIERAQLTASDASAGARFGYAISPYGNEVLIGAFTAAVGANPQQGAAYLFQGSGSSWTQTAKLLAPDGSYYDGFGNALTLGADSALIGAVWGPQGHARGATYVFSKSGANFTYVEKLEPSSASDSQYFGFALSRLGDRLVIGAPRTTFPGAAEGAIYIHSKQGTSWGAASRTMVPAAGSGAFELGHAVKVVTDNLVLVGAPYAGSLQGYVYTFLYANQNGSRCASNGDCISNSCVDGLCCSGPCGGSCSACTVARGAAQDGVCTFFSPDSAAGLACAPQSCTGSSVDCAPCARDGECPADTYCAADGSCRRREDAGKSCDPAAGRDCKEAGCRVCRSGHCVEGVCCDAECDQPCGSCLASKTNQRDGLCAPIAAGTDPDQECPKDGLENGCGADGLCSGDYACRSFAPVGAACGDNVCVNNLLSGLQCDGRGGCAEGLGTSCSPYRCASDGKSCETSCRSSADCASPEDYCSDQGQCLRQHDEGQACARNVQCLSRHCVDGVCCDSACDGQCEACNQSGRAGRCVPVVGDPVGDRQRCSDGDVCGGTCNGGDRTACAMPSSGTSCGVASCLGDHSVPPGSCDGNGSCTPSARVSCIPYTCDAVTGQCLVSCSTDGDCAAGSVCNLAQARCVVVANTCKDATTVVTPGGAEVSCAPYRCAAGACRDSCSRELDCTEGYRCRAARCVTDDASGGAAGTDAGAAGTDAGVDGGPPSSATEDRAGCGCKLGGAGRRDHRLLLVGGLVIAGLAARRRGRRAAR